MLLKHGNFVLNIHFKSAFFTREIFFPRISKKLFLRIMTYTYLRGVICNLQLKFGRNGSECSQYAACQSVRINGPYCMLSTQTKLST